MANVLVFLSDLQTGRSSSTVQFRLLRFWEARNVRRGGELMGVDMLLLDSQVSYLTLPFVLLNPYYKKVSLMP
ncbi:unnamed protein product [Brassica rapa]|uniref:Uncharacterized protein n=1 Tax=Brassica campestris TaxID=3711 RepID=A0A8D9GDQ9_BRACM|nr:unnamed protein product [Brassica rapa]